jgi:SulP family sulfate permease
MMVTVLLVPQAMAYAQLAGVPPQYGFYAGIVPVLAYAVFGTSPHIAIGPVAITSILLFDGLSTIAEPFSANYVRLMIVSGFLIGFIQILFGLLRLGVLVNLLSLPVLTGFTSAASILIIVSQLKDVLGLEIPRYVYLHEKVAYIATHVPDIHGLTLVIGLVSLLFLISLKRLSRRIPAALILVVIATVVSNYADLGSHGVALIGDISVSLPEFEAPKLTFRQLRKSFSIILAVTLIGLIETIGVGKAIEQRHDYYQLVPNKEFIALGLSKVLGGLFQAIPTSTSYSRSATLDSTGGRTVMAGAFSALFLIVAMLTFVSSLSSLPKVVLASIILMAVKNLFDLKTAKYLYRVHKRDFFMMLVTFLVTVLLSMDAGVITGVILSFVLVLIKSSIPRITELGRVPGETFYRSIKQSKSPQRVDGAIIIRYDDQIYFANQEYYYRETLTIVEESAQPVDYLILDLRGVQDIDSSGLRYMERLHDVLRSMGITLLVGGAISPVRRNMSLAGLRRHIGEDNFYPSIQKAVESIEVTR